MHTPTSLPTIFHCSTTDLYTLITQASARTHMMALYVFLFFLLTANGGRSYLFHHSKVGENVTLPCVFASAQNGQYLSWYRQIAGEQPQLISSVYKSSGINMFFNQFLNDKRFSVNTQNSFYDLKISGVEHSDSAVYFCGKIHITTTEFDNGTFVLFDEFFGVSLVQRNTSDFAVAAGDSLTLDCTVYNVTSSDGHEVYWLKRDLNAPRGVLYVHTDSSGPGRCVRSWASAARSCHYSLSKRNVGPADSGTYYCAVASCGGILFGKGTRVDLREKQDKPTHTILIVCASAVLSGSLLLNIVLICLVCKMSRRNSRIFGESSHQSDVPGHTTDNGQIDDEIDAMLYAALDFKERQSSRQPLRRTDEEPVYSAVKVTK